MRPMRSQKLSEVVCFNAAPATVRRVRAARRRIVPGQRVPAAVVIRTALDLGLEALERGAVKVQA